MLGGMGKKRKRGLWSDMDSQSMNIFKKLLSEKKNKTSYFHNYPPF